jgi:hypothetical protein
MSENGATKANTAAQKAAHEANEKRAAEEATWPLFQVEIEGDEVPWVPRADPQHWEQEDPDDPNTAWVPKKTQPAGARLENGQVVKTARATVTCRAKSKEMAKMMALRDNADYHTVNSVKEIKAEE